MSHPLIGMWRLLSFDLTDTLTGEKRQPFGAHPRGSLVLHPGGRMIGMLTPSDRKPPVTVEEKAAAFDAMFAYSGPYRLEGDDFITSVDVAWFEPWIGGEQRRTFKIDGNRMSIVSAPVRSPAFANPIIGSLLWEREA